jgi:hypothetical protein
LCIEKLHHAARHVSPRLNHRDASRPACLSERHPTENEQTQHHEYDETIRRRRQVFWQFRYHDKKTYHSGESGALT